jgi:hypothetical protein
VIDFESKEKSVRYAEGPRHPVGEEAHRTSVRNGHYDLPAWSDGYAALFPSLVAGRVETRDALWRIFAVKECRSPVASRAREFPRTVATLWARGAVSASPGSGRTPRLRRPPTRTDRWFGRSRDRASPSRNRRRRPKMSAMR